MNVNDTIRTLGDEGPFRPVPCTAPVDCSPGTAEKIAVLAERVERGEELFHPDDRRDCEDLQPHEAGRRNTPRDLAAIRTYRISELDEWECDE